MKERSEILRFDKMILQGNVIEIFCFESLIVIFEHPNGIRHLFEIISFFDIFL